MKWWHNSNELEFLNSNLHNNEMRRNAIHTCTRSDWWQINKKYMPLNQNPTLLEQIAKLISMPNFKKHLISITLPEMFFLMKFIFGCIHKDSYRLFKSRGVFSKRFWEYQGFCETNTFLFQTRCTQKSKNKSFFFA